MHSCSIDRYTKSTRKVPVLRAGPLRYRQLNLLPPQAARGEEVTDKVSVHVPNAQKLKQHLGYIF